MTRIIRNCLVAAGLILLCGCEEEDQYQLRFSHYLHVEDVGLECGDCHGELGDAGFNRITHDACIDCHDEPEAEQMTPETCGICHVQEKLYTLKLREKEDEVAESESAQSVFIHTESLEGRCAECHESLMDEEMEVLDRMQRSDVLAIREAAHVSGQDCATCHVGLDPAISPPRHDQAWTKRHGMLAMQDDAACSVCHVQESCSDCHSVMQPMSHNNLFRTSTHGAMAAWDRNSCMVCHEEDSCTSCHADTRPRSHNARWAAPGFKPTHCIGCHDTSTPGDGCVTCHEGGNDILLHEQYWGGASFDHSKITTESCYICHWTQTP